MRGSSKVPKGENISFVSSSPVQKAKTSLKMALKYIFCVLIVNVGPNWNGDGIPQPHKSADNLHRPSLQYLWGGPWPFHTALMHTLFSGTPCTYTRTHLPRWHNACSEGVISLSIGRKCQLKIALQLECKM